MTDSDVIEYTYDVNERVLCYHGPLMYEAKILKVSDFPQDKWGPAGRRYFVHYKGWKQTWDEWVLPSRMLKWSESNEATAKSLMASAATGSPAGASSKSKQKDVGTKKKDAAPRGTKRSREDDEQRKPEMKLTVPEILKAKLVDDWEAVTKNNQLVTLPRSPNVKQVLSEFETFVVKTQPSHLQQPTVLAPTIAEGMITYFDRSLGQHLLYRFERIQYAEQRRDYMNTQEESPQMPSDIYGAEHLLRMLVAMPAMVATSSMDAESVSLLREYANTLLQFLLEHRDRFFQSQYENATTHYLNLARSS